MLRRNITTHCMSSRHLILVGYEPESTSRAIAVCDLLCAGLGFERRLLVANSAATAAVPMPQGWERLHGTNRMGEFSGWQEGLAVLGTTGHASALLVNDTIGAQRYPSIFKRWALRREIGRDDGPGWIGFVDRPPDRNGRLLIGDRDCNEWVSTYCFYLPRQSLDRLGGNLFDEAAVKRAVPGGSDRDAFFSADVSPELRKMLSDWLFDGGWRRSMPLDANAADTLTFKARCICAELLLSSRLRGLGVPLREPMRRHGIAAWLDRLNGRLRPALPGAPSTQADA